MSETESIALLRQLQQSRDSDGIQTWLQSHDIGRYEGERSDELNSILCLCLLLVGEPNAAHQIFKDIKPDRLATTEGLSDFAMCAFFLNHHELALSTIELATAKSDANAVAWARQGAMLMTMNRLAAARECFQHSLMLEPNKPEVLANLAGICVRQEDYEQALSLYNRALAQESVPQAVEEQRNKVLIQLGQLTQLVESKRQLIQAEPDQIVHYKQLASVLVFNNEIGEAVDILTTALGKFPDDLSLKLEVANLLIEQKLYVKAGVLLRSWLENEKWLKELGHSERELATTQLRLLLNKTRIEVGFLDAAEKDLDEMRAEKAEEPGFVLLSARLLQEQHRSSEAVVALQAVLEKYPGFIEGYSLLVNLLTSLGRVDEAREYSSIIAKLNPAAVIQLVENNDYLADENQKRALRQLFSSPFLSAKNKANAGFVLHQVLQKEKSYEEAFCVLQESNELVDSTIDYRWERHRVLVQRLASTFDQGLVNRMQGWGLPSTCPIFVVGMPRSGTTLTEQIIGSHSRVLGAGELPVIPKVTQLMAKVVKTGKVYPEAMADLTQNQLRSAAKYYLDKVALLDNGVPHVVDKLPHNFDHVGLIALAFPNAKIIHVTRDHRDNAISNYQQFFGQWQGTMGFAFNLENIAHMINDHDFIMAHWHRLFPDRIYTLDYQKLVADPVAEIPKLIEYCGLPWEEQCMKFYANKSQVKTASIRQVRKQMYTSSSEKWRRYAAYLGPLQAILSEGFKPLPRSH